MKNQIEIFKSAKGIEIAILLEEETVWATQRQMSEIFDTTPQNITLHLKRVFLDKEVLESSTCKEYLQVQKEGLRQIKRKQKMYNLDAILSVGYRVNSKRGTQFRQWATERLKEYLIKGYTINQKRLKQLQQTIQLISEGGATKSLQLQEAKGLLEIINKYTRSFVLLNQYDSNNFPTSELNDNITYEIKYPEAKRAIDELKKELMIPKKIFLHTII